MAPIDIFALLIFFICTVGYHGIYYPYRMRKTPMSTAKGKIDLYRRSWVENIIERGDAITAVHQVRNLTMVATLFSSSSLLIIGAITNIFLSIEAPEFIFRVKVYLLLAIFGSSFLFFLFSLRHLNYFTVLVGAKRQVVEEVGDVGMVDLLSRRVNLAMNRYTLGARCYYYSLAVIAWFFSVYVFIAITILVTALVIATRDFR
jgi:uncharacterized membrane protein